LTKALIETRQMVGGLSDTVGYTLEDRAIKNLPKLLEEKYNIKVIGKLVRKYVRYNDMEDELNIFGEGERRRTYLYSWGGKVKTFKEGCG